MSNRKGGTDTVCPFYIREADKSITCEGVMAGTLTQHKFENEREMLNFQTRYCFTKTYSRCNHAAQLNEKYANAANSDINAANSDIGFGAIGQRVTVMRRRYGYTQEQLAKAAHLSRSYVSEIESGGKTPSIDTLKAISAALRVDATIFIRGGNT